MRVIAATNKDLRRLIQEGKFREDLFYRISVVPIFLPALRERKADIPLLIDAFIQRLVEKSAKEITGISSNALQVLMHYSWPGNVRELINTIEYALVLCPGGTIERRHLPDLLLQDPAPAPKEETIFQHYKASGPLSERQELLDALEATRGNKTRAAAILGVSRVTVWSRMKKYGIEMKAGAVEK